MWIEPWYQGECVKRRAAFLAGLLIAGCGGESDPQSPENLGAQLNGPAPTTVVQTYFSGITEPTARLILTADDWTRTWNLIHRDISPRPPLPPVDFSSEALVLAGLGTAAATSFTIEDVRVFERGVVATTVHETYDDRCLVLMALGQPVHVVRIARPTGRTLVVERSVRIRTCD